MIHTGFVNRTKRSIEKNWIKRIASNAPDVFLLIQSLLVLSLTFTTSLKQVHHQVLSYSIMILFTV